MRVAMVVPGLHKVVRGAEVAFESLAYELAQYEDIHLTLFGSGEARAETPYEFCHVNSVPREKFESFWPYIPVFRSEYAYEEFTFTADLLKKYDCKNFDITITCSYPFVNWFLLWKRSVKKPLHIFVTQNGDHMAYEQKSEYRFFNCDGLVCTNPDYFERNKTNKNWLTTLIPNGVDPNRFCPGKKERKYFSLPESAPLALMVSALIEEKRILEGIRAAAAVPGLHLVICGDGPLRNTVQELGQQLMGDRFHLKKLPRQDMPRIYRTADLFLHMSLKEPSANAYIEALASGLPIVTHDRDVTRWTLEETSLLVDASNKDEVIKGIRMALAESQSPERVSARLQLVESRFTWKSLAHEYYGFLQKVLNKAA